MRLPDFVVLGQGKAGTSSIYRTLDAMPDIGLSKPKELHYFSANYERGMDWYRSHFSAVPDDARRVGEVSPSYLRVRNIDRIANDLGTQTKVIYVLRKPIEQNYARYLQNICARQDAPGFHVRVRPLPERVTRVEDAIARAQDVFGPENVLPLIFERDIAAPDAPYAAKIRNFLGLDPLQVPEEATAQSNPTVMPRYLYGGEKGFRVYAGKGIPFWIPIRRLIFCAQQRNSQEWEDVSPDLVADALARQSNWSAEVSVEEYKDLQETFVVPAAERLMSRFDLDLSHWRDDPPRRIAYPLAPPPTQFRAKDYAA